MAGKSKKSGAKGSEKKNPRAIYVISVIIVAIILTTASIGPRASRKPTCAMLENRDCYQTQYSIRGNVRSLNVWDNKRHGEWFWNRFCENNKWNQLAEYQEQTVACPGSTETVYDCTIGYRGNLHFLKYGGECAEQEPQAVCGDGVCDPEETQEKCCADCGCPEGYKCDDGACMPVVDIGNPEDGKLYDVEELSGIDGSSAEGLEQTCRPLAKEQLAAIRSIAMELVEEPLVTEDYGLPQMTTRQWAGKVGGEDVTLRYYGYLEDGEEKDFQGYYITVDSVEGGVQVKKTYKAYYWEDLPVDAFYTDYGHMLESSWTNGEETKTCKCMDYIFGSVAYQGCEGDCCISP